MRESDTIARMGGDEFTVLLTEIYDHQAVATVLEKITNAVNKPFVLEGKTVNIGISIGAAVFPEDGQEGEQLLHVADNAMYDEKHLRAKEKQIK